VSAKMRACQKYIKR